LYLPRRFSASFIHFGQSRQNPFLNRILLGFKDGGLSFRHPVDEGGWQTQKCVLSIASAKYAKPGKSSVTRPEQ